MAFALINRCAALRTLSKLDLALIDHRRAVELAPMHAEAQFQIANTLRQHGSLGEAETAYINALRLAPNRSDIHRELARMLWEAGESGRFLSRLDSAIESSPAPDLLNLKCEIAYLAAMPALAEAAAQDSLRLDPHGVTPKRILGLVRRHQSDFGESLALLSSALNDSPDDYDTLHSLVETLLVKGEVDQAIRYLEKEPPADRLQKHIALRANALRLAGDDSYSYFYDYERFTQKFFIEPPSGYRDLEDFNRALEAALLPLHATKTQPLDQTLFGGTQSFGRLWEEPAPVIQALKRQLLNAAMRYVENLPDDPSHPFLSLKTKKLECAGAWSVVLATGGGHVDHIHPKGWVSASYYVRVPPEVSNGEKAGFLRLGASGVSGIHLEAERWYRPEEGTVIFFPSYIWHGVEPFSASTPRITAPFDLAPARGHS
jgi:uncharacterized protein (TIGR02466 family)